MGRLFKTISFIALITFTSGIFASIPRPNFNSHPKLQQTTFPSLVENLTPQTLTKETISSKTKIRKLTKKQFLKLRTALEKNSTTKKYTLGILIDRRKLRRHHRDHLGSSSYITDANGYEFEHLLFFPFGEIWVDEGSHTSLLGYKFTGKEIDEETGYTYFGARYYDARASVWISPDDRLDGPETFAMLNLYAYVSNNSIINKDPDGNKKVEVHSAFSKSIKLLIKYSPTFRRAHNKFLKSSIDLNVSKKTLKNIEDLPRKDQPLMKRIVKALETGKSEKPFSMREVGRTLKISEDAGQSPQEFSKFTAAKTTKLKKNLILIEIDPKRVELNKKNLEGAVVHEFGHADAKRRNEPTESEATVNKFTRKVLKEASKNFEKSNSKAPNPFKAALKDGSGESRE